MKTNSWKAIKDEVYGKKGTKRRDKLERNFLRFKDQLIQQENQ
tara:strand:+ start:2844 stop:2972 length:129 start_codon:yes stop_codon:yes gene_type:complete